MWIKLAQVNSTSHKQGSVGYTVAVCLLSQTAVDEWRLQTEQLPITACYVYPINLDM